MANYIPTTFTRLFYSQENILNIQQLLKYSVYNQSGYAIDRQKETILLQLMKGVLDNYGHIPNEFTGNETQYEYRILASFYKDEINKLNNILVQELTPQIISSIKSQMLYNESWDTSPNRLPLPKSTSITGSRAFKGVGVYSGEKNTQTLTSVINPMVTDEEF
jgi:hypothetical protein